MTHDIIMAEAVLPGHPDKLADQIADGLLDVALAVDDHAIVQVEVAVHDQRCHVNGRFATCEPVDRDYLEATARAVYERAGFGVAFPGSADPRDYACPRGADVQFDWALPLEITDPDERASRAHTDDQALHIGYAVADEATRHLPLEQHLVLALRDALLLELEQDRTLGAGPDGKLLLTLESLGQERWRVAGLVASVQHLPAASQLPLDRALRATLRRALEQQADTLSGRLVLDGLDDAIRVNPSGVFSVGGPINDNGQTGRKLVFDHYGPRVPIGGGALSGKDPWRLDRAAALRTRQLAVALVRTGFVQEAEVRFGWAPRDTRPSWVRLVCDGRVLDARTTAHWLRRYDPSLRATWEELGLAQVNWETCARLGHFGRALPWERD